MRAGECFTFSLKFARVSANQFLASQSSLKSLMPSEYVFITLWNVSDSSKKAYTLQVLVDGPTQKKETQVPRHAAPLASIQLTPIKLDKLPRGIGHSALTEKWKSAEVDKKWNDSAFAKSRERSAKRRALTDFERFKVMRLRKQVRYEEKKALAKIKASAS